MVPVPVPGRWRCWGGRPLPSLSVCLLHNACRSAGLVQRFSAGFFFLLLIIIIILALFPQHSKEFQRLFFVSLKKKNQ